MPFGSVLQFLFDCTSWISPALLRRYGLLAWVLVTGIVGTDIALGALVTSVDTSTLLTAASVVGVVIGGCLLWSPRFLEVADGTGVARVVVAVVQHTIAGYLVMVPLTALSAWTLLWWSADPTRPGASLFIMVAAVWFPLLWAPALGACWAWRRVLRASRGISEQQAVGL